MTPKKRIYEIVIEKTKQLGTKKYIYNVSTNHFQRKNMMVYKDHIKYNKQKHISSSRRRNVPALNYMSDLFLKMSQRGIHSYKEKITKWLLYARHGAGR